jgi:hypothetical protein
MPKQDGKSFLGVVKTRWRELFLTIAAAAERVDIGAPLQDYCAAPGLKLAKMARGMRLKYAPHGADPFGSGDKKGTGPGFGEKAVSKRPTQGVI